MDNNNSERGTYGKKPNSGYKKTYTEEEINALWEDKLLKNWWQIVEVDETATTKAGDPAVKIKCKSLVKTWHTVCTMSMKYDFLKKKYEGMKELWNGNLVGVHVLLDRKDGKYSTIIKIKTPSGEEAKV